MGFLTSYFLPMLEYPRLLLLLLIQEIMWAQKHLHAHLMVCILELKEIFSAVSSLHLSS